MYECELDHKEGWGLKNRCFQIVGEGSWESLGLQALSKKEINPEHIGRTDAEGETPILWPPDGKSWLIGKDPGASIDRKKEEKGMTEDEMIGWHHRLNGHEFEQAPWDAEDKEAWCAAADGVTRSWTQLSD